MPVAKSYENMEILCEPFKDGKSLYVKVKSPKGEKKVRWYSDAEYRRMYPNEVKENDIMDFNARHAFGFGSDGYITIYNDSTGQLMEFAESHHESFRFNLTFGLYTPSRIQLCDLPVGVVPVRLNWEEVMAHDNRMKPHDAVQKIVAEKLGTNSKSAYQGVINDWITKTVSVRTKKTDETRFGSKHTYTLADSEDNLYVWQTGAKDYQSGQTVSLKMKVKEHKEIDGVPTTVVWYCKEI